MSRQRLPDTDKKKLRPVYATDEQWSKVKVKADEANLSVSPYIMNTLLNKK